MDEIVIRTEEDADNPIPFAELTAAEFIAFARVKRRAYRRAKSLKKRMMYGETIRAGGASWQYVPPKIIARGNARRRGYRLLGRPHERYMNAETFSALLKLQHNLCYLCGCAFTAEDGPTQDHVLPRSMGGSNLFNVALAHMECNTRKANRPPTRAERLYVAYLHAIYFDRSCAQIITRDP